MNLDGLELEVRRMPGVIAVAVAVDDGLVVIEVQASPDADDELARRVTTLAAGTVGGPVAVEIVRWGDGAPTTTPPRIRLVSAASDTAGGELVVTVELDGREAVGRASAKHGLLGAVEATMRAARHLVPEITHLPGWARTIETTPARRFLVVASITDPIARDHRRGVAEGATPIEATARAALAALNRGPDPNA